MTSWMDKCRIRSNGVNMGVYPTCSQNLNKRLLKNEDYINPTSNHNRSIHEIIPINDCCKPWRSHMILWGHLLQNHVLASHLLNTEWLSYFLNLIRLLNLLHSNALDLGLLLLLITSLLVSLFLLGQLRTWLRGRSSWLRKISVIALIDLNT